MFKTLTIYRVGALPMLTPKYIRIGFQQTRPQRSSREGFQGRSVVYFLTGWRMSSTLPMSPSLASSRLASQPPSLEKPMFIIACKATWIRGSGWTAVAGGAEAGAAAPWSWVSFAEVVVFLGVDVDVVLSSAGRVGYTGATSLSSTWMGISTASASGF